MAYQQPAGLADSNVKNLFVAFNGDNPVKFFLTKEEALAGGRNPASIQEVPIGHIQWDGTCANPGYYYEYSIEKNHEKQYCWVNIEGYGLTPAFESTKTKKIIFLGRFFKIS
jgi:hypothetical protein